jgi:hypothetical protein
MESEHGFATVDVDVLSSGSFVDFFAEEGQRAWERKQTEDRRQLEGFYEVSDTAAPDGSEPPSTTFEGAGEAASLDAAQHATKETSTARHDTLVPPPQPFVTPPASEPPTDAEVAPRYETIDEATASVDDEQKTHDAEGEQASWDEQAPPASAADAASVDGEPASISAYSASLEQAQPQSIVEVQQGEGASNHQQRAHDGSAPQQQQQQQQQGAVPVASGAPSEGSPEDELGALAAQGHDLLATAWEQRLADKARRQAASEQHAPKASAAILCRTCGGHVAHAAAHLHDAHLSGARILGRRQEPELGASAALPALPLCSTATSAVCITSPRRDTHPHALAARVAAVRRPTDSVQPAVPTQRFTPTPSSLSTVGVQGTVHLFSRSLPTLGVPQQTQPSIETALFATGAGATADADSNLVFGNVNEGQALPGYVQQPGELRWCINARSCRA